MNTHREIAYRIDPALWMREVLGMAPRPWQEKFLCAPRGASMLALTARQVGKTTAAAVGMAQFRHVHAGLTLCGGLPYPAAECRGRPQGQGNGPKSRGHARQ